MLSPLHLLLSQTSAILFPLYLLMSPFNRRTVPITLICCHKPPAIMFLLRLLMSSFNRRSIPIIFTVVTNHKPYRFHYTNCCHKPPTILFPLHLLMPPFNRRIVSISPFTSHAVRMTLTDVTIRQPYCPRYTYLCYQPAAVKSPLHLLLSPFISHTVSMALIEVTIPEPYCLY